MLIWQESDPVLSTSRRAWYSGLLLAIFFYHYFTKFNA